ncbi:MAG: YitT family protein [Bacteroidota bacterium]|nr:YitT family protein [Bacteroidota bacterium]
MTAKILKKQAILEYFFITIGAAVMAIGIGVFLVDAKVVPGGVSGLSMTIYYLTDGKLPVGVMIWILNLPLYLWGIKELGKTFGIRTFYGFTLNSLFIDLFRGDMPGFGFIRLQNSRTVVELAKYDFFFYVLIGATLLGLGLGIIFKFKGTTGGSDIVAAIMQKKFGVKPGQAIMLIDFFVIASAGLCIEMKGLSGSKTALTLTLYALLLLLVSSNLVDILLDGFDYAKMVYIISDNSDAIADAIVNDLSRGATALKARGIYTNVEREIIFTSVTNKELSKLLEITKELDPHAFVIINNVHEVLGKGFRRRF